MLYLTGVNKAIEMQSCKPDGFKKVRDFLSCPSWGEFAVLQQHQKL